jgi:hypothetical protein
LRGPTRRVHAPARPWGAPHIGDSPPIRPEARRAAGLPGQLGVDLPAVRRCRGHPPGYGRVCAPGQVNPENAGPGAPSRPSFVGRLVESVVAQGERALALVDPLRIPSDTPVVTPRRTRRTWPPERMALFFVRGLRSKPRRQPRPEPAHQCSDRRCGRRDRFRHRHRSVDRRRSPVGPDHPAGFVGAHRAEDRPTPDRRMSRR